MRWVAAATERLEVVVRRSTFHLCRRCELIIATPRPYVVPTSSPSEGHPYSTSSSRRPYTFGGGTRTSRCPGGVKTSVLVPEKRDAPRGLR